MTDKQIIIDGVDVSGCKKYEHEIVRCNATLKNMCFCGGRCTDKKNADCYFKQLKRKEQECEELKKYLHKNFEEKDKLHLIIDRLLEASGYDTNTASAEDFEDVYKNMRYEKQQLDQLKAENEELKNFHINLVGVKECDIRELLKLKQALTEIEEVAEKSCCLQPTSVCEEYENCKECNRTSDDETVKQILQKISECEVK